jgi:hypothetical protein
MARILDNMNGRRMIRLSPEDVLSVVSFYQQQLYGLEERNYQSIQSRLRQADFYLPEEV